MISPAFDPETAPLVYVPAGAPGYPLGRLRARVELAIVARDGSWDCFYCGSPHARTLEHVRPARRGGSDEIDNLVLSCRNCNLAKSNGPAWFFVLRTIAAQYSDIRLPRRRGLCRFARPA